MRNEHLNGLGNGNWSVNDDRYHYCECMEHHEPSRDLWGTGDNNHAAYISLRAVAMTKMRKSSLKLLFNW